MAAEADESHHIKPQSRDGCDCEHNLVEIPSDFHEAFHYVFHNLTPEEQVKFVQEFNRLAELEDELDGRDLYELRNEIKAGPTPAIEDY